MDGLVFLTVMVGTLPLCSEKCRVVFNRLRASYPWLVLDGTEETSSMGSLSGVKCCFALKAQSGFRERIGNTCFLKVACPRF